MIISFRSEKITDHICRITDGTDVCEYLIIGDKRALLIDTGYGIGDLKGFISTICDLPLSVYLTHGHVDHASGSSAFDEVHMDHKDLVLAREHCSLEFRKKMLSEHGNDIPDELFLPQRTDSFMEIRDEEIVDLGNVHVLMVSVPGHTQGSIVPIVLEDRTAIFGDASGVGTLICLEGSTSVEEYDESLKKLKTYESLYDIVLRQHGTFVSDKCILDENIENCELILKKEDDHVPTEFMDNSCFWARKKDPVTGARADGKQGNICYTQIYKRKE